MNTIRIKKPNIFSFQECLWFLSREYDDCLLSFNENKISRAIRLENQIVTFTIAEENEYLLVEVEGEDNNMDIIRLVEIYIEEWLDLARDISPFYEILVQHPELKYMAEQYSGLRMIGNPDIFETLIWSITSQQINLTFAFKLKRALTEKYGESVNHNGSILMVFPNAETLARLTVEELQSLQFSKQKAKYIINSALAFTSGEISKPILRALPTQERLNKLIALNGVGPWTANAVLMQSLNDTTRLLVGDVGLLKALENLKLIANRNDSNGVAVIFEKFDGWQGYLVNYLWRSLAKPSDFT